MHDVVILSHYTGLHEIFLGEDIEGVNVHPLVSAPLMGPREDRDPRILMRDAEHYTTPICDRHRGKKILATRGRMQRSTYSWDYSRLQRPATNKQEVGPYGPNHSCPSMRTVCLSR
jgi:hypothetical protein